jgi:hypothetical protein
MKRIGFTTVLFLLLSIPTTIAQSNELSQNTLEQRDPQSYIGLQYKDLPSELYSFGGRLVGDFSAEPSYAVSWVVDASCQELPCPTGTLSMLWLERFLAHDSAGKASFEVIDVLQLPDLPEDIFVQVQIAGGCTFNGVKDSEIIAVVKYEPDQEIFTDIRYAWRANLQTQSFEEVSPDAVTCENLAYGV